METFVRSLDYQETEDSDAMFKQYVLTGKRDRLLAALLARSSPLGELSENVLALAAVDVGLDDKHGWKYLKSLPVNRRTRKAMMEKRWVVRLFRRQGEPDFRVCESEHEVMVDFDVAKSQRFSMRGDSPAYRALMWAAARGQIDGVVGAPPVQDCAELLSKQMLLWMVSRVASQLHGLPPPYFAVGLPSTSPVWSSVMWQGFRSEFQIPVVQLEPEGTLESQVVASNLTLEGRLLRPDLTDISESSDRKANNVCWGALECILFCARVWTDGEDILKKCTWVIFCTSWTQNVLGPTGTSDVGSSMWQTDMFLSTRDAKRA